MKVIFLDVDGVLNSSSWATEKQKEGVYIFRDNLLNEAALLMLRDLVEETNAVLVLSSSWRKFKKCRDDLANQLTQHQLSIFSDTPETDGIRGDDINAWLVAHPCVESYVILDDDADMLECQIPYLVQTTFEDGLQDSHCRRAKAILNHCAQINGLSLFHTLVHALPHYEVFFDGLGSLFYQNGDEILSRSSAAIRALDTLLFQLGNGSCLSGLYEDEDVDDPSLVGFYYLTPL